MAFFKLRKGGDDTAATARQPESVEVMRRRARHRLIGAGVLVLVAVVGFPLLFDTQPRPIAVDIPIEIPDRNKVKPLTRPVTAPAQTSVAQAPVASGTVTAPAAASAVKVEAPPPVKSEPPKVEAKVEPKAAEPKATAASLPDDGARALALLEGKGAASQGAGEARFIVQVGAFADDARARETRQKVERAGMKTYTHVAETKDGKLTRVRVGPFPTKAEADKAAEKIKALDLDPHVLKL